MATQYPPKKNTAFTLYFTLYKADGTIIANPGTITKKISKDGGAVADIAASVTEINTTYGLCSVVLSADEMNADAVSLYIVDDTSGCVPFTATILTTSATFAELKAETAAILEDTGTTLDGIVDEILLDTAAILEDTGTTLDGIVDEILLDTAQIGTAGAGLTAIPWNAAWDAEVQSECTDALNAYDPPTATELTAGLSAIPAAVWNYLLSAMSTVGSVGLRLAQWLTIIPDDATAYGATDLSICNNALVQLGNEPLLNLTDTTKKAVRLCVQFYDQTVDEVLRAYNWNCATVRDTLTVDETAPAWGFKFRYALPADCLRVIGFSSASVNWKIENGYILADSDGGEISYIKSITAADMDALLRSAVSARLAAYLAFPLTNSATVAKAMFDLYKEKLADAHTMDAFENGTGEHLASDSWIHARGQ